MRLSASKCLMSATKPDFSASKQAASARKSLASASKLFITGRISKFDEPCDNIKLIERIIAILYF